MAENVTLNVSTGEITTETYEPPTTPASVFWERLRAKRNLLLVETDYLANTDVTMTDEMRDYRQALRDLPANTSDPSNPTWPTKPAV